MTHSDAQTIIGILDSIKWIMAIFVMFYIWRDNGRG